MKIKTYNLTTVMKLKSAIQNSPFVVEHIGDAIHGSDFVNFVRAITAKIPKAEYKVVFDSVVSLAGEPITMDVIRDMAWRLAGNHRLLVANKPVPIWTRQKAREWMPLQIVEASVRRNHKDDLGADFTFRIMAGTACPRRIKKFWTKKQCGFFSTTLGFSKPWGRYPFKDLVELVGLRLYGAFDPELCLEGPDFDQISVPGCCDKHNKTLMKQRARVGFDCPEGYTHDCRVCPVGYRACPAACHPRTYEKGVCLICKEVRWIDPLRPRECVNCVLSKALKPSEQPSS